MIRHAIWRTLMVTLGLALAAMASFFVLATMGLEYFTRVIQQNADGGVGRADAIDIIFGLLNHLGYVGWLLSAATIVPALLLVLIGELARIRSVLFYVAGGGLALVGILALAGAQGQGQPDWPVASMWTSFATAGFAGGFVYWIVAGRTA